MVATGANRNRFLLVDFRLIGEGSSLLVFVVDSTLSVIELLDIINDGVDNDNIDDDFNGSSR
jgi:hypothetical protein